MAEPPHAADPATALCLRITPVARSRRCGLLGHTHLMSLWTTSDDSMPKSDAKDGLFEVRRADFANHRREHGRAVHAVLES